jgi:hypothetical protein
MKLYKLTNKNGQTKGGMQWGEGVRHTLPARIAYQLCSPDVLHAYRSLTLTVLMDSAHAQYLPEGKLWECEGDVVIDDGTKVGCISLTTVREVEAPAITTEQRITFAIRVAARVYKEPTWRAWAEAWLTGAARSPESARAAARAAAYVAYAARAAAYVAYAARAAAYAARAAYVARAARAAARAAAYVAYAARAAAYAARAAYAADAADAAAYAARAADAAAYAARAAADVGFITRIADEILGAR